MSFSERLRAVFRSSPAAAPSPVPVPVAATPFPTLVPSVDHVVPVPVEPLPDWLTDEETIRDEGVLYGTADADPEDKLSVIRAYTARQTTPISQSISQLKVQLTELTGQLTQHESRQHDEQQRLDALHKQQRSVPHLARSMSSLVLGVGTGAGAFFLIDQALQPTYANLFVSLGICLVGVAGPFSQPAEPDRQRAVGWFLNTFGLPLAASAFVLATALDNQSVGRALLLAGLLLVLLPTTGRLIASSLRGLSAHSLRTTYPPLIDTMNQQLTTLQQEINGLRAQKAQLITLLNQNETEIARHNARRDALIQLFMSEFTLARSFRERLTETQRRVLFD